MAKIREGDPRPRNQRRGMAGVQGRLAPNGTLMVIGAVPSLQIDSLFPLAGSRSVSGQARFRVVLTMDG